MTQPPVTLAEFRDHLNLGATEDTDQDQERWRKVVAAAELVEDRCGPIRPRTVVSRCDPLGRALWLRFPALSVDSITDSDAQVVVLGDLDVDLELGRIRSLSYLGSRFYTVTYTAGFDPIPQGLMEAVLIVAAQMWNSQRGPEQTNQMTGTGDGVPRGFVWPNRAVELIQPHRLVNVS